MSIYKKHGFTNREEYLSSLADDFDVSYGIVEALADLLGESEDFDGLLNALEDDI